MHHVCKADRELGQIAQPLVQTAMLQTYSASHLWSINHEAWLTQSRHCM
jgi:hypothetical protein